MKRLLCLVAALALCGAAHAQSSSDDQAKVQQSLMSQGFSKWKRIELDHGVWEVDDATDASGKVFDLRVDAKSLKIIAKEAD